MIYLIFAGCTNETITECSLMNFASEDLFAIITLLVGSTMYFRIAQYVINALYKGELPIKNATGLISSVFQNTNLNRKQKRTVQKRK